MHGENWGLHAQLGIPADSQGLVLARTFANWKFVELPHKPDPRQTAPDFQEYVWLRLQPKQASGAAAAAVSKTLNTQLLSFVSRIGPHFFGSRQAGWLLCNSASTSLKYLCRDMSRYA